MSKKILVLDDDLNRLEAFTKRWQEWQERHGEEVALTTTTTADETIKKLQEFDFDAVFLDHDLGGKTMTPTTLDNSGSGVARWMHDVEYTKKNPKTLIVVHSFNPDGAAYMMHTIPAHQYLPGIWGKEFFHDTFS